MNSILGNISKEDFLANYWQKKPLVIRGAFPDFEMPFTAEELAGLACDTDAPSRMIIEHGLPPTNKPWEVKLPPFEDEDFTTLPDSHCSFLINDLERYIPELGNLIEPFRFIPDWRIDDLMVSYAEDQGSVGPHTDDYDVFLIQGEGKLRWKVITRENYPKALIPGLPIALLKEFDEDEDWLLEAGDMLYLPPNTPHYGVAEGACFTFSVGFQAPRTVDLIQNWLETFSKDAALNKRFTDKDRTLQSNSGEITKSDLETLSNMMLNAIKEQQSGLNVFLGKQLTETRGEASPVDENLSDFELDDQADYERESWLRLAYIEEKDTIHFFADGHHLALSLDKKTAIHELCENYYFTAKSLEPLMASDEFREFFKVLIQEGGITVAS